MTPRTRGTEERRLYGVIKDQRLFYPPRDMAGQEAPVSSGTPREPGCGGVAIVWRAATPAPVSAAECGRRAARPEHQSALDLDAIVSQLLTLKCPLPSWRGGSWRLTAALCFVLLEIDPPSPPAGF